MPGSRRWRAHGALLCATAPYVGNATLGICRRQPGAGGNQAHKVGTVIGRHVGMAEAGGHDTGGLGTKIGVGSISLATLGPEQPIDLIGEQRFGG